MLVSEGFLLRPFQEADAYQFCEAVHESMDTVGKWMPWARNDFHVYDAQCWFDSCTQARATGAGHEFGIFSKDGRLLGGCGLNQFNVANKFCNLGYWVRQSEQRKGVAVSATVCLRDFCFARLPIDRIEIVIEVGNEPSCAVARKSGATYECLAQSRLQIHGKAVAAHVYSFVRNDLTAVGSML